MNSSTLSGPCWSSDPNVVFLIFASGKLVCVGAKKEEDVYKAVEKLMMVLDENGVLIKERRETF